MVVWGWLTVLMGKKIFLNMFVTRGIHWGIQHLVYSHIFNSASEVIRHIGAIQIRLLLLLL